MRNKRGWIRIVEAFIAIMLIAGAALILMNKGYLGQEDISQKVYNVQHSILKEIAINDAFREEILKLEDGAAVPQDINIFISSKLPNYLNCTSQICALDSACGTDYPAEALEKQVYAQSTAITATTQTYNPKQLKLYCWVK